MGGKSNINWVLGNNMPKPNKIPNTAPDAPTVGVFNITISFKFVILIEGATSQHRSPFESGQ